MRAEEVHREKLKSLGYKDEVIEELVTKYIASCTYEFAEAYHAELLNIDSVSNNENDSEVAFCDSPIHDFDRCPFIKQRNDYKSCRYYNHQNDC